ncbi:MAG: hypothetical protein QOE56_539 [Solirubrobacterales bacterium]|jgi:endonuclease/exonuclease/phosphatase family metal-dependent hydrolase|nr:hypothetical protein [Solirubrobacterales bacterium]
MEYWRLKLDDWMPAADRKRVVANLETLRAQLDEEVPEKNTESDLLLGTWNLRDFGKLNRKGFGDRQPESFFYIAEVLSRFDFVAVQEVNELNEWEKVMKLLGPNRDWVATDVTDPGLGGNGERLTYLYDTRKVRFRNIAGELVLPADLLISTAVAPKDDPTEVVKVDNEEVGKQFRRSPFAALFQAAWFKYEICTVHIYYGGESGKKLDERVAEIERVGQFFGERAKSALADDRSLILLGDFNIVGRKHKTMEALEKAGFKVPQALQEAPATNVEKNKYFDQIAFQATPGELDELEKAGSGAAGGAGSVDLYKNLYTADQFEDYKAQAAASPTGSKKKGKNLEDYYLDWRTYQFSDHAPLWVRLPVNDSANYLQGLGG